MINFLTYRLLILFSLIIGFFNRSFIIQLGRFLGSCLFYISPVRKKVAKINLKIAFPDLNKQQINLLIKNPCTGAHLLRLRLGLPRPLHGELR